MEGKLRQVPEESCERSGDIMRKFLHRERAITYMSDDVLRSLLHRES